MNHHHHHVAHVAWISMTISRQPSLSFIVPGSSSAEQRASSHSWSMYVLAGRPTPACPYVGFHRRSSLMSSSLLFQHALSISLGWFVRWGAGGRTAASLSGAVSTTCSRLHTAFLCSSHLAYSQGASLESRWCSHTTVLI